MIQWYKELMYSTYPLSVGFKPRSINHIAVFNNVTRVYVPVYTSEEEHINPTKTYFWYLFALAYRRPILKKFYWPKNKKDEMADVLATQRLINYYAEKNTNHFLNFFLTELNFGNYKPDSKVLFFRKNKILFRFKDAPHVPIFFHTKLISNYIYPEICLRVEFPSPRAMCLSFPLTTLAFFNSTSLTFSSTS